MEETFKVHKHALVPKHEKLSESEIQKLLQRYNIELPALPLIAPADPGLSHLTVKNGDVIKITRKSVTAGSSIYYRRVGDILRSDSKTEDDVEFINDLKPKKPKKEPVKKEKKTPEKTGTRKPVKRLPKNKA